MGRKKYNTDEERKAAKKARDAAYYQKHKEEKAAYDAARYKKNKEEILAKHAEYRANHKEEKAAYNVEYYSTPFGRAACLVCGYRLADKKYNRGECTIDAQWIVDNIFTQPCHYCGEMDWHKLGCDRIDNTKPHTPENVVCCCGECNLKKQKTEYSEFMRMIGKKVG